MPPAKVVRRRRLTLLGGVTAAFIAGAGLGAGGEAPRAPEAEPVAARAAATVVAPADGTPAPAPTGSPTPVPTATPAPDPVDALSLERQVGKLVVLRFDGTTAPAYVRRVLRNGQAAGAILFRDNVAGAGQLRALTRSLRAAGRGEGTLPIVCVDQEGGPIRIVAWAPPANAAAAQRPHADARAAGQALRGLGINVSLAPVADVPSVNGAALASRAFSRDPARAASAVSAAVGGWLDAGVAPTVKHFPGLGGATVNTDLGSSTVGGGAPTAGDLAPFKAAIAAGVPLVMSSNARYPALDGSRIAAQSRPILEGLLREKLGFRGVVITDSIEAAAVRATGSTAQIALRSIRAGNDIVLTTGSGSWIRTYRALLAEARASNAFRARVRASAARVLALQRTLS